MHALTLPARRTLLLLALAAALAPALAVDQASLLERKVKAAYLLKFANYVDWPEASFARSDSPLVIGVFGAESLAAELQQSAAGRQLRGRTVEVRPLRRGDSSGVHILFFSQLERDALENTLEYARTHNVLTVTDSEEVRSSGAMVRLLEVDARLRFEVDLRAAAAAGLKISALMLSSAYRVQKGP